MLKPHTVVFAMAAPVNWSIWEMSEGPVRQLAEMKQGGRERELTAGSTEIMRRGDRGQLGGDIHFEQDHGGQKYIGVLAAWGPR